MDKKIQSTIRSPDEVLREAFAAFAERDGQRVAALATVASLQALRDRVRSELNPRWAQTTPEALQKYNPDMPLEVARWRAAEMKRGRDRYASHIMKQFAGAKSISDIERMTAAELLSSAILAAPAQVIALGSSCRIIDFVRDRGDLAYVLFWLQIEKGVPLRDEPAVAVTELVEGEWRLRLDPASRWGLPGLAQLSYGEDEPTSA